MLQRLTLLGLALLGFPAAAAPWQANYTFTAAGVTVMEARVELDIGGPGAPYTIETRTRARGLAALLFRGEQVSQSEGTWHGAIPLPRYHRTVGNWRGSARRIMLEYGATGTPRIAMLEPPQDIERTAIPHEALAGTMETLSAMLQLSRQVRETGRCEAQTRIFDGRRLTQLHLTTDPVRRPEGRGQPSCVIESRLVAGMAVDRPQDARPMRSIVHFGPPVEPDAPMLPIRIEVASHWWGNVQAVLSDVSRVGS